MAAVVVQGSLGLVIYRVALPKGPHFNPMVVQGFRMQGRISKVSILPFNHVNSPVNQSVYLYRELSFVPIYIGFQSLYILYFNTLLDVHCAYYQKKV